MLTKETEQEEVTINILDKIEYNELMTMLVGENHQEMVEDLETAELKLMVDKDKYDPTKSSVEGINSMKLNFKFRVKDEYLDEMEDDTENEEEAKDK